TDVDGDLLTYSVVASPAHGTLTGIAPALIYSPDAQYSGTDSFTFKVNDGRLESAPATVSLRTVPIGVLAVDQVVSADGFGSMVTTPQFSTVIAGETLIAFVTGAQPTPVGLQTASVSGGNLAWTLVTRADAQAGTAEIWKATALDVLSNINVSATFGIDQSVLSLTVVTFASSGGVGASAAASAPSGAPSVSLTTTTEGSLVYGAGNDWDGAVARIPAP